MPKLSEPRAQSSELNAAGHDIHALAACIEKPNGLTQEEMQKLYDASFQDGVRVAEEKFYGDNGFRNTDGKPEWGEIARWCQRQSDRLRAREGEFINSVTARCV